MATKELDLSAVFRPWSSRGSVTKELDFSAVFMHWSSRGSVTKELDFSAVFRPWSSRGSVTKELDFSAVFRPWSTRTTGGRGAAVFTRPQVSGNNILCGPVLSLLGWTTVRGNIFVNFWDPAETKNEQVKGTCRPLLHTEFQKRPYICVPTV